MSVNYRSFLLAMSCGGLAAACCAAERTEQGGAPNEATLHYTVSLATPGTQRVAVAATLDGLDGKRQKLRWTMQRRFAFVRLPEPLLDGPIRAAAGDAVLDVERLGPYEWEVAAAGQTTLELRYSVPLTHRTIDAVKERDAYEYPYLADDHGMLVSPTLFGFPEEVAVGELRVRFDLPDGWRIIAPWPSVGKGGYDPGGREALLNDLIAIGDWRVHEVHVGQFVGSIAFAPGQDTLEKAAVEPIRRIVEYEIELFGRPPEGRYLFLFGRPEGSGLAGSPKTHSMTLSVEPRLAPLAGRYLPHLVAHEFYHTWAAALLEMPDELRWLNEGITDYYAYLVSVRLGLSSWEEFADTLAEKMQSCATNPSRGKLSLAEAGGEVFFSDRNAYDLVYDGGLLVGAWLDRAIRAHKSGESLDDLMRAFINNPQWSKETGPSLKDFFAAARRFADEATAAKLEHFVTEPFDFDPLTAFAAVGIKIGHEVAPAKLDLRANLDGTRVVDVDRSGLAYRVGIRESDRLIEVNGEPVAGPGEIHRAWRKPADNRIRVKLERDGKQIEIDEPIPQVERFIVPPAPWRDHE